MEGKHPPNSGTSKVLRSRSIRLVWIKWSRDFGAGRLIGNQGRSVAMGGAEREIEDETEDRLGG